MSAGRWAVLATVLVGRAVFASGQTVIAEAEGFRIVSPDWQAKKWGTNYYCGTLANTFLSRKAYLGAPEHCERSEATKQVQIPKAGTYLALVRYEAVYRFETRFRLRVEQGGKVRLDRLYGARDNLKIWPFKEGLKKEVAWSWGAVENVVWEGHDATVELDEGPATLTLVAERQPEGADAARRNVDLVMLTSDRAEVEQRIAKENYLPLDGMLTQAGDLFLRVQNNGANELTINVPPGKEHSPYWVHQRNWTAREIMTGAGKTSEWVEVGGVLDSLNDGQWTISPKGGGREAKYSLEFGVPRADGGGIESIRRLDGLSGEVELAYDADTRYSRRVRLAEEVLYELLDDLKRRPVSGIAPQRTLIYGYTFPARPKNAKYTAALGEFIKLMGATALVPDRVEDLAPTAEGLVRGYIDVRSVPTEKLEEYSRKLEGEGRAKNIAVVSMGDEIDLPRPPGKSDEAFVAWLKSQNKKPGDIDPDASQDWSKVHYSVSEQTAKDKPGLYYWSKIWSYRYGIGVMKERTAILRRHLPNASVGANFSPHGPTYMGDVHHWISVFREGGMTMPWGEDYIWQVPVGTQQINELVLDMFRAGVANHPDAKIQYYVMAHAPGNTPASWRRQFYGDLAHGVKVINLYEMRPVQAAYTENHVSSPEMSQAVRVALHELGRFEDVVQDGHVRSAEAGLWFSEAADVWQDNRPPFGAGKRALYIAARHQQLPLDVVVEGDDLSRFKVIYLADRHVSRSASAALADWVRRGGQLFATAGAGMRDEMDRANGVMGELLGIREESLNVAKDRINRLKEDLPYSSAMDVVTPGGLAVLGARSRFVAVPGGEESHVFGDGRPAVVSRKVGEGRACYCGFLPGLAYFAPAIPRRPLDRGSTDDSFAHFIPTQFNEAAGRLIGLAAGRVGRPLEMSNPLVEATVIEAKGGIVIPLINWSGTAVKGLEVRVNVEAAGKQVFLASGGKVREEMRGGKRVFVVNLDVADALVIR